MDAKGPSMWLPGNNMRKPLVLHRVKHMMKNNGEGCHHSPFGRDVIDLAWWLCTSRCEIIMRVIVIMM
jgi:hypothetical protein